ncbi:hypothetical protein L1278_002506 [Pontibacter sp. HSC-36F09]|nr:hypothetical protein [Pontibacter sp. HSC-36F09]
MTDTYQFDKQKQFSCDMINTFKFYDSLTSS